MTATTETDLVEVLHALRVKGLTSDAVLAEMTGCPADTLGQTVAELVDTGLAKRREGRMAGTMLTPAGRDKYDQLRSAHSRDDDQIRADATLYEQFLPINTDFKQVCAAWQMRDGDTPNDHSDADYDASVVADLAERHERVSEILTAAAAATPRWARYRRRLTAALEKVQAGDNAAFARPMYDSYHDIWMELHQDLLLTVGRERGAGDE